MINSQFAVDRKRVRFKVLIEIGASASCSCINRLRINKPSWSPCCASYVTHDALLIYRPKRASGRSMRSAAIPLRQ
jgi:hypothetical protein